MEIAGLVLGVVGALPVIVQIVEGYKIIIETTQARRYMPMLEQDLRTEEIILRQTYERLLNGIVPAWELEDLPHVEPSSSQWKTYNDQIHLRLRESYQDFNARAKAIAEVVQGLKKRLEASSNNEIQVASWSSRISGLAFEAGVRTRLTLRKKDFTGAVSKIRENNSVLSRLVDHSTAFEPTRRANSRAKFAKKIRTTAQGLFSSLCNVMRCQCVNSHTIGLSLRKTTDEPGDPQESAVCFEIIFGTENGNHGHHPSFELLDILWKGKRAVPTREPPSKRDFHCSDILSPEHRDSSVKTVRFSLGASLEVAFPKLRRSPSPSKPKPIHKVQFSEAVKPARVDPSIATIGDSSSVKGIALSHITDLCAYIKQSEALASQPIGFIPCLETPDGFNLHHQRRWRDFNKTAFTLQDALRGNNPGSEDFDLTERLNIALTLSSSILQLCNTHWLEKVISPEGILCSRVVNSQHYLAGSVEHPPIFLIRQPSTDLRREKQSKPFNFTLLSLGVILTHIIIGRRIEAIDIENGDSHRKKRRVHRYRPLTQRPQTAAANQRTEFQRHPNHP